MEPYQYLINYLASQENCTILVPYQSSGISREWHHTSTSSLWSNSTEWKCISTSTDIPTERPTGLLESKGFFRDAECYEDRNHGSHGDKNGTSIACSISHASSQSGKHVGHMAYSRNKPEPTNRPMEPNVTPAPDAEPYEHGPKGECPPITTFSLLNVRGLKPRSVPSKVPFISDILHDTSQIFIGITETWLNDHQDAEIHIKGNTLFRQDRTCQKRNKHSRDSGGVALYIKDDAAINSEIIFFLKRCCRISWSAHQITRLSCDSRISSAWWSRRKTQIWKQGIQTFPQWTP